MIILSFSKTTAAVQARRKSVTRREWNDAYAERFKRSIEKSEGLVQAWTASPHRKGKRFGTIKVLSVTKEPTREIPDGDWEAEGFAYMTEHGLNVEKDVSCEKLWRLWRQHPTLETWVIRFEVFQLDSEILDGELPATQQADHSPERPAESALPTGNVDCTPNMPEVEGSGLSSVRPVFADGFESSGRSRAWIPADGCDPDGCGSDTSPSTDSIVHQVSGGQG